jgi:hypothetical protein
MRLKRIESADGAIPFPWKYGILVIYKADGGRE